jgi:metal-responsive CopG/Arc/MetJ family transcriptional regulator
MTMKTAISIDGPLLEEADRTARTLGLSRSRLVSLALTEYRGNGGTVKLSAS